MRKKNGMKKSVLCLILTVSMAMSGIPVAAERVFRWRGSMGK